VSYTLAFALQLRKKHVKTSVRVTEEENASPRIYSGVFPTCVLYACMLVEPSTAKVAELLMTGIFRGRQILGIFKPEQNYLNRTLIFREALSR
jgi:hypothetical protein